MSEEAVLSAVISAIVTSILWWLYCTYANIDMSCQLNVEKGKANHYRDMYDNMKKSYLETVEQLRVYKNDREAALRKAQDYERKVSKVRAVLGDLKDGEFIAYTT